jgi:hypothetical protein
MLWNVILILTLTGPQFLWYICTVVTIKQLIFSHSYDKTPVLFPFCFNIYIVTCWVSIDRFRIDYRIFWTHLQRVPTLHRSLSHTDYRSQPRSLVTASSGGRSPASGLKSLQGGDCLTPTSYSDRWLRPILLSAASSPAGLTSNCLPPNSADNSQLVFYSQNQSQSYFKTAVLPPISLSWHYAPRDSRPEIIFCNWTLAGIVLCNILSDKRIDLPLMNKLRHCIAYIECYWKFSICTMYKTSFSTGFAKQIMPILLILC